MSKDYNNSPPLLSFHASIPQVLAKSICYIAAVILIGYIAFTTNSRGIRLVAGVLLLMFAIYYVEWLFALARLRDSVKLTHDGLLSRVLFRESFTPYKNISSIEAGASYVNGIQYKITTADNSDLVVTQVIKNHIIFYNELLKACEKNKAQ